MKVRYNKTIFTNGMMGKSTYGRTDSDYYKGAVKRVVDGIIYPQGGIKNITLDETSLIPIRQYERLFEIKKGKFIENVTTGKYLIGQRMFSDTVDLLRVNFLGIEVSGVQYLDTLNLGADLREYLVQVDDKIIVSTTASATTRRETYFSGLLEKYADSDDENNIIADSATYDIEIDTDKTLTNIVLAGVIGAGYAGINSITDNGGGSYTVNVTAYECEARDRRVRDSQVDVDLPVGSIPPDIYYQVEVDEDGSIWTGELYKTIEADTLSDPVLIDDASSEEVTEDTPEYRIFSSAYQRRGLIGDGQYGLITMYKVYRVDKGFAVRYEGRIETATTRVAIALQADIANPVTAFGNKLAVLEIEESGGDFVFKAGSPKKMSDIIEFAPVNPNYKTIDKLLDELGYGGARYYGWNYDPINDYFEIFVTSDAGFTTEIQIGGIPITQRPEMAEVRIFGGSGRKIAGNNKRYKILAIPRVNTYDYTANQPKTEAIIPEALWCYSILDVDKAGLAGKFDNRLILTQFAEGSSIIAFSRLRTFFDFTFDGQTLNDGYVSEFKDDLDLKIERIIEHKSMVLFTNKGIYASSLLDTSFNPNSFAFKRVHTMVPQTTFAPEFLNGDMIFLDGSGSKLYAMIELKESTRYSIADLTVYANDIFSNGITVTTIDLAQEVGSEFVLVSSFSADGLVNYNSDNDILSWTTLSTEGIYTKVFTEGANVYVYDLYTHSLTRTKPKASKAVIELLEPEVEFQGGDKLSFHEYYKVEKALVKIYGRFDKLTINNLETLNWESQPFTADDNYTVNFELPFTDEKDIIITMEAEEELILQSLSITIDVGE